MNLSGPLPSQVEFNWPETARPVGLFVDGAFQPLPVPAEGRCAIALPAGTHDRLLWLSWMDTHAPFPALSGPLAARLPWPQQIPVEGCRVRVHVPRPYRFDAAAPFAAIGPDDETGLVPPALIAPQADDKHEPVGTALAVQPVPQPGQPFELGPALKLSNPQAPRIGMALAAALIAGFVCWRIVPLWLWLTRNESVCWLGLAVFWWLCLSPSWCGPLLALWAGYRALPPSGIGAARHGQRQHGPRAGGVNSSTCRKFEESQARTVHRPIGASILRGAGLRKHWNN